MSKPDTDTSSTALSLATDTASMSLESQPKSLHLLELPPEIRLHLYRIIFGAEEPILLSISPDGFIQAHARDKDRIRLSLQFLRTCRQVYHEATPVLYGYNSFSTHASKLGRLKEFKQTSRMCIEKIKVKHGDEKLELGALGAGLPCVQEIDILCSRPLGFLLTISAISKALPCSWIRDWPCLEVYVTYDAAQVPVPSTNESSDRIRHALSHSPFRLSALDAESTVKGLGLGHEMPNFAIIRIHGKLSEEHARGIAKHTCTFGDCGFERIDYLGSNYQKNTFPSEDAGSSTSASHHSKTIRYRWKKSGTLEDAKALNGNDSKDATMTLMNQWVPRLSGEWYQKVLDAGLQPSQAPAEEGNKTKLQTDDDVDDTSPTRLSRPSTAAPITSMTGSGQNIPVLGVDPITGALTASIQPRGDQELRDPPASQASNTVSPPPAPPGSVFPT